MRISEIVKKFSNTFFEIKSLRDELQKYREELQIVKDSNVVCFNDKTLDEVLYELLSYYENSYDKRYGDVLSSDGEVITISTGESLQYKVIVPKEG